MRVYVDTMVFIYWFDPRSPLFRESEQIFRTLAERHVLVSSLFVKAELMVHPTRHHDRFSVARIERLFSSYPVELVSFDEESVRDFARLRANTSVKPMDALHLALASAHGAELFITNDRQLLVPRVTPGVEMIDLRSALRML